MDGLDASAFLRGAESRSPRNEFAYYFMDDLNAVRDRRYKLHVAHNGQPMHALYDLLSDIGETTNLYDQLPDEVKRLETLAQHYRETLAMRASA